MDRLYRFYMTQLLKNSIPEVKTFLYIGSENFEFTFVAVILPISQVGVVEPTQKKDMLEFY